ncbi:hypothetical protein BDZ89DRAFT_440373 [Hymenopellis radicata]|nr:hypothetical protein BDZ89DRAFT_440373 [Hymenopellis radicata]
MLPDVQDHHIRKFPLTSISVLSPYSGLILSIVLLVFFLIKFYVLEGFLLQKMYGTKYTDLDEVNRRGFVNHHIAGATKIVIFIIAVYPFGNVAFGTARFHTPFIGSLVTMGDILVISAQMLIGMFLFELIYRTKISPISMVHHIASILVGQAAITISIAMNPDSSIEFLLCTVWVSPLAGAFDIISEFLPHLTIILYRVYPDSHRFLKTIFRAACLVTFFGTVAETVVVMYLFGQLWSLLDVVLQNHDSNPPYCFLRYPVAWDADFLSDVEKAGKNSSGATGRREAGELISSDYCNRSVTHPPYTV